MTRARRLINRLLTACVWLVAIACFGLLGFIGVGPRTGRYTTLTVLSGSMRPNIPVGAIVIDTAEPASELRVGQVVTYSIPVDDHHVVTHRVVRIVSGGPHPVFQTKGDANESVDPWQAQVASAAVWRVRAVIPGLGSGIHWLRGGAIHLIGVLFLPGVVGVWWALSVWRDDDEPEPDVVAGAAA